MTASAVAQPDPSIKPLVEAVAVRLADEGIPVRAIARATHLPSDEVYEALRDAIARGSILEMPRDDWPASTARANRVVISGTPIDTDEGMKCACVRYFKASPLEAGMLTLLLKRDEVTKEQLHHVIETTRGIGKVPTEIKMVDVMICKLRKKLKDPHDITIKTMWGLGYYMEHPERDRTLKLLLSLQEA
jgi:DNA-binding response OmpR family regulator